jgi:hypothetical protein
MRGRFEKITDPIAGRSIQEKDSRILNALTKKAMIKCKVMNVLITLIQSSPNIDKNQNIIWYLRKK